MGALERFRFTHQHREDVEGGFYFHPNDEDLSLGTPERKKPLSRVDSVSSRIETAVARDGGNRGHSLRSRLRAFIEHPLANAILGAALGAIEVEPARSRCRFPASFAV